MLAAKPMAAGSQHRPKTASGPAIGADAGGAPGTAQGSMGVRWGTRKPSWVPIRLPAQAMSAPAPLGSGGPDARRVLVTGAAGFVGGHVLPLLAGAGHRVAGIGRGRAPHLPAGVTYATIDLLDEAALSAFVAQFRPTAILHLAGLASVADSASGPGQTWRVNVNGLMNLVAAVEAVPGCTSSS
ncbi:NAD-dependent epimerase/dehydratase family protein [Methylobacterium phyllosphaerae]